MGVIEILGGLILVVLLLAIIYSVLSEWKGFLILVVGIILIVFSGFCIGSFAVYIESAG